MTLKSILYEPASGPKSKASLQILNQLLLPHQTVYVPIKNVSSAFTAIKWMLVRGAPAIALVAALALAVDDPWTDDKCESQDNDLATELETNAPPLPNGTLQSNATFDEVAQWYIARLNYLVQSRPTAVNLADAARKLSVVVREATGAAKTAAGVRDAYIEAAVLMLENDVRDNENIGRLGKDWIVRKAQVTVAHQASVLTHCNTGSLATAGYGTALGIIRSLHASSMLRRAYYTETRPYNQGARLTGYELLHDGIPATLITDSMAASLFYLKAASENIVAVIVGADRVAANGDTANKIGTYALACLARQHGILFVVAAPRTTIDLQTQTGQDIVIEERPQKEVLSVSGPVLEGGQRGVPSINLDKIHNISTAAPGTTSWNPSFDVTPAELIDAIVTEVCVAEKNKGFFRLQDVMNIDTDVR